MHHSQFEVAVRCLFITPLHPLTIVLTGLSISVADQGLYSSRVATSMDIHIFGGIKAELTPWTVSLPLRNTVICLKTDPYLLNVSLQIVGATPVGS